MNLFTCEDSKKESEGDESKISLSPIRNIEASQRFGSVSPLQMSCINMRRFSINQDPYSALRTPFSETRRRQSAIRERLTPNNGPPTISLFESIAPCFSPGYKSRKNSIDIKIEPPNLLTPNFGILPEASPPISDPISRKDIEDFCANVVTSKDKKKVANRKIGAKLKRKEKKKHKQTEITRSPSIEKVKKKKAFHCIYCPKGFDKAQALGGHMSRKHAGKSHSYNHKKIVRRKREGDRMKLLLAKKKFFDALNYDYEDLVKTPEGRMRAKSLINKAQVKKIKKAIQKNELDTFIELVVIGEN